MNDFPKHPISEKKAIEFFCQHLFHMELHERFIVEKSGENLINLEKTLTPRAPSHDQSFEFDFTPPSDNVRIPNTARHPTQQGTVQTTNSQTKKKPEKDQPLFCKVGEKYTIQSSKIDNRNRMFTAQIQDMNSDLRKINGRFVFAKTDHFQKAKILEAALGSICVTVGEITNGIAIVTDIDFSSDIFSGTICSNCSLKQFVNI